MRGDPANLKELKKRGTKMQKPVMYTPKDVQEMFGMSRKRVYDMFRQDSFPSIKIGKRYYITESAFYKWLKEYE